MLKDAPVFRKGTSPNKVFDYLASVRPIIHCGDTTFDYLAEANAGICVPPGDARALANAVTALARMPDETLMDMGRRGRRYVEDNFNISRLTSGLERVLHEVVDNYGHKKIVEKSIVPDRMRDAKHGA
jgi:glycosyltransferase involved in cell wall biosynthesis